MTISKRDARLLLILLGIIILFVGYFVIYKPYVEKTEAIRGEITALQSPLAELREYYANLDVYYAGIESSAQIIEDESIKYAGSARVEDLTMYAIELRDELGVVVDTISFTGESQLAALDKVMVAEDGSYAVVPTGIYNSTMILTGSLSYEEMKQLADYLAAEEKRTTLESANLSYNGETTELSASLMISRYFISDGAEEYVPTEVPTMPIGVDQPFGSFEPEEEEAEDADAEEAEA